MGRRGTFWSFGLHSVSKSDQVTPHLCCSPANRPIASMKKRGNKVSFNSGKAWSQTSRWTTQPHGQKGWNYRRFNIQLPNHLCLQGAGIHLLLLERRINDVLLRNSPCIQESIDTAAVPTPCKDREGRGRHLAFPVPKMQDGMRQARPQSVREWTAVFVFPAWRVQSEWTRKLFP